MAQSSPHVSSETRLGPAEEWDLQGNEALYCEKLLCGMFSDMLTLGIYRL